MGKLEIDMYLDFQKQLEEILRSSKLKFSSEDIGLDGKQYHVRTAELTCTIKLTKDWVGYDLTVNEAALGRRIGNSVDTDNYSLEYDPLVTRKIAKEIFACVNAIANKNIYAGSSGGNLLLAIPTADHKYKLTTFIPKPRWWKLDSSTTEFIGEKELLGLTPNIKPLS